MLKNALKFGTLLTKEETKKIIAGNSHSECMVDDDCPGEEFCVNGVCSDSCIDVTCVTGSLSMHKGRYTYCPSGPSDTVCGPDDGVKCENC